MPSKKPSKSDSGNSAKASTVDVMVQFYQSQVDDIDAIAEAEGMSKSEVLRLALDYFVKGYKTGTLGEEQASNAKNLNGMDDEMRELFLKTIKLNAQILYFSTLPFSHGVPRSRLNQKAFQALFVRSSKFAEELINPKSTES